MDKNEATWAICLLLAFATFCLTLGFYHDAKNAHKVEMMQAGYEQVVVPGRLAFIWQKTDQIYRCDKCALETRP
jgi:hypothetical protein